VWITDAYSRKQNRSIVDKGREELRLSMGQIISKEPLISDLRVNALRIQSVLRTCWDIPLENLFS
jgi:hypothetical protein